MPIRINSINNASQQLQETVTQTERTHTEFNKTFYSVQKNNDKQLNAFLSRLDALGNKLVQSLSLRDLADYRENVKAFLRSTFGQSTTLHEESVWDFYGRPKVLAHIKKINQALDELGNEFINNNPKPLELLAKIDQIRGLILDLYG